MSPTGYHTGFRARSGIAQRADNNACSGWNCLSDATQVGIILVVIASIGVVGYLYWRFKLKPSFASADDQSSDRATTTAYWEVTRRDPNSISITISRESRPRQTDQQPATESRASLPASASLPARTKLSARTKKDTRPAQQNENDIELMPSRLGTFGASETHLVPPPPPLPTFWTVPALPTIPPPAAFGPPPPFGASPWSPSGPYQPPPPPPPQHPGAIGLSATAATFPPSVPPPYFGYGAPQPHQAHDLNLAQPYPSFAPQAHHDLHRASAQQPFAPQAHQGPNQGNAQPPFAPQPPQGQGLSQASTQPAFAPPPGLSPDERARNIAPSQSAPVASGRNPRRGWFSFLRRSPTVGHARTISSPSPPESLSSVSSYSSDDERENSRRQSDDRENGRRISDGEENARRASDARSQSPTQAPPPASQPPPQQRAPAPASSLRLPRQRPRASTQAQPDDSQVQSESGASSSLDNSSVQAQVHDEDEPARDHTGTRPSTGRGYHPRAAATTTTTTRHPRLSPSSHPAPPASPDMSIPPREPRRARVAFTLPGEARAVRIGSLPTTDARRVEDVERRQRRERRQRERELSEAAGGGEEVEWEQRAARGDRGEGGDGRRGEEQGWLGVVKAAVGVFLRARRVLREG